MKIPRIILTVALALAFFSFPAVLRAQRKAEKLQKIGCVDVREVFEAIPQSAEAQKELDKKQQAFLQKKVELENELETLAAQAGDERGRLKPQDIIELNAQIANKRRELAEFVERSNQELAQLEQKLLQPLLGQIQSLIREVAQKNGLSMVIDRSTYVLYVEKEYDITVAVIEALEKKDKADALERAHD